jgi:hypothetical protein
MAKMWLLDLDDSDDSDQTESHGVAMVNWAHVANGNTTQISNGKVQDGDLYNLPLLSFPDLPLLIPPTTNGSMGFIKPGATNFPAELIQAKQAGPYEEEKAGLVVIRGNFQGKNVANFITFIAEHIHEGPLFELKVNSARKATVTFQHLAHAQEFISRNQDSMMVTGQSCLGAGYQLFLGRPQEWSEELHKMNHPGRERRRLTFAKARLFGDQLSPQQWERDVMSIAGGPNVSIVWVFNAGNGKFVDYTISWL